MEVLAMPDRISKGVLNRGLDASTAFEIVSIDIADITVGENIGARLQTDQAAADMRVATARAEVRRAEAIACQQEMKAKLAESRSLLVLAEARIPAGVAQAFRAGWCHLGRSPGQPAEAREPPSRLAGRRAPQTPAPPVPRNPRGVEPRETEGGACN
jgi:hypothetical protein